MSRTKLNILVVVILSVTLIVVLLLSPRKSAEIITPEYVSFTPEQHLTYIVQEYDPDTDFKYIEDMVDNTYATNYITIDRLADYDKITKIKLSNDFMNCYTALLDNTPVLINLQMYNNKITTIRVKEVS